MAILPIEAKFYLRKKRSNKQEFDGGYMSKIQGFILYRIWYGDTLVYLGRTKQPLQSRIHGHLFKKPMHRSIAINLVTKIDYAEFKTESDMNLYEIYFINLWKPPLNIDDKCKDELTVNLPDVEWNTFTTPLWSKWKNEITAIDKEYEMKKQEKAAKIEMDRIMSEKWHSGEITEEEYYRYIDYENDNCSVNIDDIFDS